MSNDICFFLYQKDFTEKDQDKYFLLEGTEFKEVTADYLVGLDCYLVTHDYWLIAPSIYKKQNRLPKKIIDVVMLSKILVGTKAVLADTQQWDISKTIKPLFTERVDFEKYMDMFYRREELDLDIYMLFSHKLSEFYESCAETAANLGEWKRFINLEVPVFNMLTTTVCKGIPVDKNVVRAHKVSIEYDYYRTLKSFAEKHDVHYELPSDGYIKEKLTELGYDTEGYDLDFLIEFFPSIKSYTNDLKALQKIASSLRLFNSISVQAKRLHPIVESHWTSTSRIYYKSPAIQNMSKKYRDIFTADGIKKVAYVDYDQFEVGVMASLSEDPFMLDIYKRSDAYTELAQTALGDVNKRKDAKKLFLSFTYGMSLKNILKAVQEMGGSKTKAKSFFLNFTRFQEWKESIWEKFEKDRRISTIDANYLNRISEGELSEREKRIAVNHVIQGTATYIFKLALLDISEYEDIEILIPMHDAVFFQFTKSESPTLVKDLFEKNISNILTNIEGRASIENFFKQS